MPTGEGKEIHGRIKIYSDELDIPDEKPKVQVVEYQDGDEDGKRTLIDPSFITLDGDYWVINKLYANQSDVKLTETPLYLRINQNPITMKSDAAIKKLTLNAPNCLGCNTTAQVSWSNPGDSYVFFNVYAGPCGQPFDIEKLKLVAERLPGSATSAVLNDLSSGCTQIWVVPYKATLNNDLGYSYVMGEPSSVSYQSINCVNQSCADNVMGFVGNIQGQSIGNLGSFLNATGNNFCMTTQSGPDFTILPDEPYIFELNFPSAQLLQNLNLYYVSGTGKVIIETAEDCCANYTTAQTIDLQYGSQGSRWINFSNGLINQKPVDRIRIKIIGLPETGLALRRLLFCITPAQNEECPNEKQSPAVVTPITEPIAVDINTHSAVIEWNTTKYTKGVQEWPITGYKIQYSTLVDDQGNLVQPISTTINDGIPFDGGVNTIPLTPLVPNTTYFVDVLPDPTTVPCVKDPSPGPDPLKGTRISFTTLPLDEESNLGRLQSSPQSYQAEPPVMSLYPNPTQEHLNIRFAQEGAYTDYIIHTINGIRKQEGALNVKLRVQRIDLPRLAPGMYLITLLGNQVRPQTKTFIIINEE